MKYIKRVLIILFLILIVSGCRVNYDVKINKDLSVNERVIASEKTDRLKSRTNLDINQSVSYLYKIYKTKNMGEDEYSITSADNTTSVVVNNSYNSIEEYSDNFKTDIFEESNIYEDNNHIIIDINQNALINSKASNRYVYDEIEVTFELPFEVINNNADKVNNNKYTWYIKADSDEYKRILLEFNGEKIKNTALFNFGDKYFDIGYEYLVLVGAVVILGIIIFIVYLKNKKNNVV